VRRELLAGLGAGLHLALLAPAWWLGGGGAGPFLVAITAACWLEASAERLEVEASGSRWLPTLYAAALLAVFWTALATSSPTPWALPGAALILVGAGLRRAAIQTLGERFTDPVGLVAGHRLTTSGPFARMRHPSELGTLCLGIGAAVSLGSPASLAPLGLLAALVVVRIREEDRLLAGHFGEQWSRWAERAGPLWPRPC